MASDNKVPLLGSLPLEMSIRVQTDGGKPTVAAEPGGLGCGAEDYHDGGEIRQWCVIMQ